MILVLFFSAVVFRLISLVRSRRNEKSLLQRGAIEYGKGNSKALVLVHTLYYISCITEAVVLKREANDTTYIGAAVFAFSMIMLWIVIASLKEIWTVKLYILDDHRINRSFIFKYFRHPNYFLNIIPELVGLALIGQAWYTLVIGLPIYLVPLAIRIIQEEKAMKKHFKG